MTNACRGTISDSVKRRELDERSRRGGGASWRTQYAKD